MSPLMRHRTCIAIRLWCLRRCFAHLRLREVRSSWSIRCQSRQRCAERANLSIVVVCRDGNAQSRRAFGYRRVANRRDEKMFGA